MHRQPRRALLALVVLLLAGCAGSGGAAGTAAPGSAPVSTSSGPLLLNPVGLAEVDGTVWAAWAGTSHVSSLAADGSPGPAAEVGDTPLRLAVLDGIVWVTAFGAGTLDGVDPATGAVVASIDVGAEPEGVVALDGHLFVVLQSSAELVEVDAASRAVVRRYPVGGSPRQVATDGRALFVTDHEGGAVVRLLPGAGGRPVRSDRVCPGAQSVLVHDGAVRVACGGDDSVVALDPGTLALESRATVAGGPDGLAVDADGRLLVSLQQGPGLVAVTASGSTAQVATWSSGDLGDRANVGVVVVGGTAYVSDPLADVVHVVAL